MKKKLTIVCVVILLIAAVLFLPIPRGTYDDGGTRTYAALTYKIVVWNKLIAVEGTSEVTTYHKVSVFWFPNNLRSIDKLWQLETSG